MAIDGVSLIDLHPPGEVVAAYYDVATAMEGRDRRINEARERATAKLKAADAGARRIVTTARAGLTEKVLRAEGETIKFLDLSRARRGLSEEGLAETLDSIEQILRGTSVAEIDRRRRQSAALSDFRYFWEVLGKALSGREMILVDSDRVHGQRNLFLVDPELLRPTLPMAFPPERRPRGLPEDQ